ncbi:MAG: hypothetical protein K0Q55_1235 [Verrucomicrobia bacterium]|jgi:hypothetical protein|nr:hypothetical protein [Verrucomicrobiota bacterium]
MKPSLLLLLLAANLLATSVLAQAPKHTFAITTGGTNVLTDADLIEYRFADHTLKISGEAMARLPWQKVPIAGVPFHLVVDGERVYSGRFISPLSSMTYKEPTILLTGETNGSTGTLIISGPVHHEPRFQPGTDPRIDARITRALGALGKLNAGFPGGMDNDEAFARRTADVLAECQQIKPGATRAQLLKIFTEEGGISNARHRTYVHRSNPYLKVDVEFTLTDPKQSFVEEKPTDIVSKISKPYPAFSVID